MNPIDSVVNFFAPEAGLRRMKARKAGEVVMNYDGASKGRRTYGWKATNTSADAAAFGGARVQMRQLARDMVRNRALAERAKEVIVGAVVGTGIVPSINAPKLSQEQRDRINEVIQQHLMTTDIDTLGENTMPMMQEIVMGTVVTDGEVLARRRMRDPRFATGLALPFQVELLECDYLNETIYSNGENPVLEGVEYGPTGRIEAYHIWNQHPGSVRWQKGLQSSRVPAAEIIHVRRVDRPGQTRGVSWFAPVMLTLGEISDYTEAQILKQRMAALLAGVVMTDQDAQAANLPAIDELAPGALVQLPPGSEINWTTPPKVDGYKEFLTEAMGVIAVGMGITRESLSGDLSGTNFSSARMGHMVMDRNVQRWQQNLMINQFCAGLERWVIEAWPLMRGVPKNAFALDWTAPRRPLIDPTREIPAYIDACDAGLTSIQRTQRELGFDPEVIRRERVQDMELNIAAKLPAASPKAVLPAPAQTTGD
jgi:lambda family phage portal protein